jgi:hypothetical protein
MPSKLALGLLAAASLGSAASIAQANVIVYKTNYPPVDASAEINGSLGGGTARSFVAAGMMGAKFYGNKNVAGMEASLLATCQSKTQAGSTWPEGCDFAGLTSTLNSTFAEHWIQGVYDDASQGNAINAQISGLRDYHSPLIAPLYGQADHWVTAYEMSVDSTTFALQNVKFFDGGSNAFSDGDTNSYFDGFFQIAGSIWKNVYYQMIVSVAVTDPYFHKFLVTFDPPSGVDPRRVDAPWKYGMSASPGVLHSGEQMSAELAQERAWNALFAAQVNEDDVMWSSIERSMPGPAWEVAGFAPSGEAWRYYLVPMLDEASSAVALVQLSAHDGAFEQIGVGSRPRLFLGVTRPEAIELAGALLADDEVLQGGELTWDPRAGSHARSPLFPYYEFHVSDSKGHPCREIIVMLQDGTVHEMETPSAASPESR